ncbi:hypothetical protein [Geobacillus phage GR1]|nr:hypothetical protein [Geobacillus phage GR1]
MSRLHTMSRFAEPDPEPNPITYCEECDEPIYDGQHVVWYDGDYFCSEKCLINFIGAEEKFLYVEDY